MRIDLNILMTEYFKKSDTITVSAQDLQTFLVSKNDEMLNKSNKIKELKQRIINLETINDVLKNKIKNHEVEYESNFKLDLKI